MRSVILAVLIVLQTMTLAAAVQPDEVLKDPALETRARHLSRELRCMVCQNQSIDDSDAPLARDLRLLVRDRLTAGDSDQQVLDFLVARYGDFVLLRPPVRTSTFLLWTFPPAIFLAGAIALALTLRRRKQTGENFPDLTKAEQERLATLVDDRRPTSPR
ncbi:MAG: cytochrome c-type biogenesis protein CcmH [Pseudolabrys sp.]|nr:cytochrome c-type biogenesis protein CcmH [Pseudolabrys sp.]MBV9954813.1 cytochrome c-type biogenesis protein CcmH [Pseudolabrys sp.]